jgi:hypothetical protein
MTLAPQATDGNPDLQQVLGGNASHSKDQLGGDQRDLPFEIRAACRSLSRSRIRVPGWAALQDIADIDLLALQPDGAQHLIEQSTGRTDKRLPKPVFFRAGSFSDDQQSSAVIPDAKHCLRPGLA